MRKNVCAVCLLPIAACLLSSCSPPPPGRAALEAYARAKSLYVERRWDEALTVLRERDSGGFPAASLLAGKILFFKNDDEGAEAVLAGTLEEHPHHDETRKWLARLLIRRGRPAEAEKVLAAGLADDPEDAEMLTLLGKTRLIRRDTAGAVEYFLKAEGCFERLAEAPLELADLYRSFGLREKSLAQLELALALLGKESGLRRSVEGAALELKKELKK